MNLTPYDVGERAQPMLWQKDRFEVKDTMRHGDPGDIGKVDFDNEEGATVATVHVSRDPVTGSYVVHVMPHNDDVRVARHGYDEEVVI